MALTKFLDSIGFEGVCRDCGDGVFVLKHNGFAAQLTYSDGKVRINGGTILYDLVADRQQLATEITCYFQGR